MSVPAFWHRTANVGDTLTPVILDWLGIPFTEARRDDSPKLIGVGSIMHAARDGDTIMGTGFISRPAAGYVPPKNLTVLATRGPLTTRFLGLAPGSVVESDPALLLPLIYPKPPYRERAWKYKVGFVPHYVDASSHFLQYVGAHRIDVLQPWKTFVDRVCECKYINSSSLHGIIIAEAYGIPARWVQLSKKVVGGGFKFHDYYSATGRNPEDPPRLGPAWVDDLQAALLRRLKLIPYSS